MVLWQFHLTQEDDDEDMDADEHLYNALGNLREWISREEVRRFIAKKFRRFLNTFKVSKEGDRCYYVKLVEEMTAGIPTT